MNKEAWLWIAIAALIILCGLVANSATQCRVQVGFGQTTIGQQCFSNYVMVGHSGQYILCAPISVECAE